MNWHIVTDSSCDELPEMTIPEGVTFGKVPFVFQIGHQFMTDDDQLDINEMLDAMEKCPEASHSACPAPGLWEEEFGRADQVLAFTISANLSGSYDSAMTARHMVLEQHPDKKIFVLNSLGTGPMLSLAVQKAVSLIAANASFETVTAELSRFVRERHTLFALCSFNNLVKNGRVSRLAGLIAGKLGIWGIGAGSPEGKIEIVAKVRCTRRIMDTMLDKMKQNGFTGGTVMISHCLNPEFAEQMRDAIKKVFANVQVLLGATGGLCSFYAERRGLIIVY